MTEGEIIKKCSTCAEEKDNKGCCKPFHYGECSNPDGKGYKSGDKYKQQNTKIGMYGETPRVKVGKFTICKQCDNKIWIEDEGGEGAEFPNELLEKDIEVFFNKYF